MSHTPHELAADFPNETDVIHNLREQDRHFARLADEYHEVNRAIHRAETGVEPMSEMAEKELRLTRMRLKDEIAAMISAAAAAT